MDDLECFCSNTAIHSLQHCSTAALQHWSQLVQRCTETFCTARSVSRSLPSEVDKSSRVWSPAGVGCATHNSMVQQCTAYRFERTAQAGTWPSRQWRKVGSAWSMDSEQLLNSGGLSLWVPWGWVLCHGDPGEIAKFTIAAEYAYGEEGPFWTGFRTSEDVVRCRKMS